jgi:hopanoid biosynthesis associated RND transporter like protein HpnN
LKESAVSAELRESWALRALRWLSGLVFRHPRWFFWPQIVLFVLSVAYTVTHLQFNTSRNDLVGKDKRYHQNFLRFKREFPGQDDLVAVVESENAEKNRQFVERLGARLEGETNLFQDVLYINDVKMLGRKALLFFEEQDLRDLHGALRDYRPFLRTFSSATNLNSLFRLVNQQFRTAKPEQNAQTDSLIKALPALERMVRQAQDSLRRPGVPPSPGVTALFDAGQEAQQRQYITFASGRIYLLSAHARREDLNERAVDRLRELVRQTQVEVGGINVGITGEPVLEIDEMRQSQTDSTWATLLSLLLVALIFIYGYKETGRPIKATLCLVVGLGYTMAYTTLVVGHLNILTITFAPMLVGLAIDFGVHLVTRYEEELRHGHTEREALEKAMVYTGMGIFTGCFTTAAAFLAMSFTNFAGIQEMGLICGGGLIVCLVPMMTLLPTLLLRGRQNVLDHTFHAELEKRARVERLWLERPGWVAAVCGAISLLAAFQIPKVRFDYNLLNMQSAGLPAVVFERKLIDAATKSVLFGAVIADSLPQAVALERQLTNLPAVSSVDSMARYLLQDQTAKLALVGQIKQELATIEFADPDPDPASVRDLDQTLLILQGYLNLAMQETRKAGENGLTDQLRAFYDAIAQLRWEMAKGQASAVSTKLGAFQRALFRDIQGTFHALRDQDDGDRMRAEDLPPGLRNRFIGATGRVLLQVYPKADVWQRDNQEVFVRQLRTLDPDVTGTPVQLYEYTSLLVRSYEQAALYSLGAIALMVLLHFRKPTAVLLALLPVFMGSLWVLGLMGWLGIPFNPANIMTAPLVVGIGVTNGIHILNRFAEEHTPSILTKSTGKAVLVSGLTTIAGFGSLVLAKHQGIASLGYIMALGTATCMIAALTFLPAFLNLVLRRRQTAPGGG